MHLVDKEMDDYFVNYEEKMLKLYYKWTYCCCEKEWNTRKWCDNLSKRESVRMTALLPLEVIRAVKSNPLNLLHAA